MYSAAHAKRNGVHGKNKLAPLYLRILKSQSEWPDKDEFLDVIYWLRQLVAIIIGIIWGILPLKGFLGIVLFCMVNTGFVYIYASYYQQVDESEFGEGWEFAKEGFMTTFAGFLVTWIIVYTGIHANDSAF
ncbi:uncharacterized protein RAB5IF homolog [Galendromus occidentalis]|uniref:Uncharacterized protein RAB5IF homolog n=1 Tax=Galendromus occidentalis TaxID=34638 RepID=A0AAJ6VWQ3_9ACAR|nr:uncharacterized protein RAB5IF homolog [Galendromus occidentalis]